jgi:hypothetical protein
MQASRIHHVSMIPKGIMDVRRLLHDIGRAVGNEISKEPRRPADASDQVLRLHNRRNARAWNIKSSGSLHGDRVMRGKSHATLAAHGFTKSFRKIHLVVLSLIQAKVHTALVVLSRSLLPSVSYLCGAFNAEDRPLMNTYLQHCCTICWYLFPKFLRAARHCVRRKHNAEGRTKVNKSNGKRRTTLHMFYFFKIPRQFSQHFGDIILLASSLCHCSLS